MLYENDGHNFDRKKHQNMDLFKAMADKFQGIDLIGTAEQVRQCWKSLKSSYNKVEPPQ